MRERRESTSCEKREDVFGSQEKRRRRKEGHERQREYGAEGSKAILFSSLSSPLYSLQDPAAAAARCSTQADVPVRGEIFPLKSESAAASEQRQRRTGKTDCTDECMRQRLYNSKQSLFRIRL